MRSRSIIPGSTLDPDARAWVGAVMNNGGSVSPARQQIVNDLIVGMKYDNVWTKFDRLGLLAADDNISARTDVVSRTLVTAVGTPTFTANQGYAGELTGNPTSYLNSNYRETTAGNKFVRDDCHLSVWIVTACVGGYLLGQVGHAAEDTSSLFDNGVVIHSDLTDANATGPSFTYTSNLGHFTNCRLNSTDLILYQNGSQVQTKSSASNPADAYDWFITCINNQSTGFPENGTNGIIGAVSMGASLTAPEVSKFYARLRTYMSAVGVP